MSAPAFPDSGWPADFQGGTVTGHFVYSDGTPVAGKITFTPTPTALLDYANKTTVVGVARSVTLDSDGRFSVVLPATDDPDINPVEWNYKVAQNWPGGQTFFMEVPQNQTTDVTLKTPVPMANGVAILRGPASETVVPW